MRVGWSVPEESKCQLLALGECRLKVRDRNQIIWISQSLKPGKFSPYDGSNQRLVPAFSVSSLQRNTSVTPPPVCAAFKPRPPARSTFRQSYDRGDFPISLKHDGRGNRISWKVNCLVLCNSFMQLYLRFHWSLLTTIITFHSFLMDSGRLNILMFSLLFRWYFETGFHLSWGFIVGDWRPPCTRW